MNKTKENQHTWDKDRSKHAGDLFIMTKLYIRNMQSFFTLSRTKAINITKVMANGRINKFSEIFEQLPRGMPEQRNGKGAESWRRALALINKQWFDITFITKRQGILKIALFEIQSLCRSSFLWCEATKVIMNRSYE